MSASETSRGRIFLTLLRQSIKKTVIEREMVASTGQRIHRKSWSTVEPFDRQLEMFWEVQTLALSKGAIADDIGILQNLLIDDDDNDDDDEGFDHWLALSHPVLGFDVSVLFGLIFYLILRTTLILHGTEIHRSSSAMQVPWYFRFGSKKIFFMPVQTRGL
jgi:hypothetical protein